jgi:hypothetical protein
MAVATVTKPTVELIAPQDRKCAGPGCPKTLRLITRRQLEGWTERGQRCPNCHAGRR